LTAFTMPRLLHPASLASGFLTYGFLRGEISLTPNPQPGEPGLRIYIAWRQGGPAIPLNTGYLGIAISRTHLRGRLRGGTFTFILFLEKSHVCDMITADHCLQPEFIWCVYICIWLLYNSDSTALKVLRIDHCHWFLFNQYVFQDSNCTFNDWFVLCF
jgi:hypothetical protein